MNGDEQMTVDITLEGMNTQESIARVNKAVEEFDFAKAEVASLAKSLMAQHWFGIQEGLRREYLDDPAELEDALEQIQDLRDAIKIMDDKQNAFLGALGGR